MSSGSFASLFNRTPPCDRFSTMGMLSVNIWDATGAKRQEVKMPEEERVSRIEEAQRGIVANCNLPQQDDDASQPAIANAGG